MLAQAARHKHLLFELLARGDALLAAPAPDLAALAGVRWPMVRELKAYQLFKHGRIFDPVIAGRDAARAREAARLKAACIAAAQDGEAFVLHWSGRQVAEWADYRVAARGANMAVRKHLDAEHRGIAALLAGR